MTRRLLAICLAALTLPLAADVTAVPAGFAMAAKFNFASPGKYPASIAIANCIIDSVPFLARQNRILARSFSLDNAEDVSSMVVFAKEIAGSGPIGLSGAASCILAKYNRKHLSSAVKSAKGSTSYRLGSHEIYESVFAKGMHFAFPADGEIYVSNDLGAIGALLNASSGRGVMANPPKELSSVLSSSAPLSIAAAKNASLSIMEALPLGLSSIKPEAISMAVSENSPDKAQIRISIRFDSPAKALQALAAINGIKILYSMGNGKLPPIAVRLIQCPVSANGCALYASLDFSSTDFNSFTK